MDGAPLSSPEPGRRVAERLLASARVQAGTSPWRYASRLSPKKVRATAACPVPGPIMSVLNTVILAFLRRGLGTPKPALFPG